MEKLFESGSAPAGDLSDISLDKAGYVMEIPLQQESLSPLLLGEEFVVQASPAIDLLARLAGVSAVSLFGILSDAIAMAAARIVDPEGKNIIYSGYAIEMQRMLAMTEDVIRGARLADKRMLAPRYWDLKSGELSSAKGDDPIAEDAIRISRRASCCLLYKTYADGGSRNMCSSCPHLRKEERLRRINLSK